MPHALIRTFDIGAWLEETVKSRHLVGREIGRACRERIESQLERTHAGAVTTLNGTGIELLDYTGADECFGKLISRLQAMEYGDQYLVFAGLTPTQERTLAVALERRRLAAVIQQKDGPAVCGYLSGYLRDGYDFLGEATLGTARDWSDAVGRSLSLGSTTMINLHKARLVQRINQRFKNGGRQYVYRLVEGSLPRQAR